MLLGASYTGFTQVGIGTNAPHPSAALEVSSTTQGFLPPRMKEVQLRTIKNPVEGLLVYCYDCKPKGMYYYDGRTFLSTINSKPSNMKSTDVYSPATGRIWMDRNLGASRVAKSPTDEAAYGDLYQWGRNTDGHEKRNSTVVAGPVSADYKGAAFITSSSDWLAPSNDKRWNLGDEKNPKKNKAYDPCPEGYRIPTESEWDGEVNSWGSKSSAEEAFESPLKLTLTGQRRYNDGTYGVMETVGHYWYSKVNGVSAYRLGIRISNTLADKRAVSRSWGLTVRCIKEQ